MIFQENMYIQLPALFTRGWYYYVLLMSIGKRDSNRCHRAWGIPMGTPECEQNYTQRIITPNGIGLLGPGMSVSSFKSRGTPNSDPLFYTKYL